MMLYHISEKFPHSPIHLLRMRSIVFQDNDIFPSVLNIYIHLLITTYFIDKNGFCCVRLFSLSAFHLPSFFSISFPSLSRFLLPRPFSFFFSLYIPQQASNSLTSSHLWISCPSAIPLRHGDLLKIFHLKIIVSMGMNVI